MAQPYDLMRMALRRTLAAAALAVAALLPLGQRAEAHPHIWVTVRSTVVYENGAVVGFRHAWTFDEFYTAMAIEGLDTNKDGTYSREELAELAKVNIEALKEFAYFTAPRLKGAEVAVDVPKDYWLEHKPKPPPAEGAEPKNGPVVPRTGADKIADAAATPAHELTLHFTLPLAKPVLAEAEGFSFSIGDPTFFIAFEPAAGSAVTLSEGAPKGCKADRVQFQAKEANPSKPGESMASVPSDLSVSVVSAPTWQISCAPAG